MYSALTISTESHPLEFSFNVSLDQKGSVLTMDRVNFFLRNVSLKPQYSTDAFYATTDIIFTQFDEFVSTYDMENGSIRLSASSVNPGLLSGEKTIAMASSIFNIGNMIQEVCII